RVGRALPFSPRPRERRPPGAAGVRLFESWGLIEVLHPRNPPAVAPADDAAALRINVRIIPDHPPLPRQHVVVLQAAVINQLPKAAAVTGAAAIIRRDHGVPLLNKLADDVQRAGAEIAVHAAMHVNDERKLAG